MTGHKSIPVMADRQGRLSEYLEILALIKNKLKRLLDNVSSLSGLRPIIETVVICLKVDSSITGDMLNSEFTKNVENRIRQIFSKEMDRWNNPQWWLKRLSRPNINDVPDELIVPKTNLFVLNSEYPSCVYFLIKNKKVVYVGQSKEIVKRISEHRNDKDFDTVFFIPCSNQELNQREFEYIKLLSPQYNKIGLSKK